MPTITNIYFIVKYSLTNLLFVYIFLFWSVKANTNINRSFRNSETWYSVNKISPKQEWISITVCPNNFWQCNTGICIPNGLICDLVNDCQDFSDEDPLICGICETKGHWPCADKSQCLSPELLCNSNRDCNDGSDEDIFRCERKTSVKLYSNNNEEGKGLVHLRKHGFWGFVSDSLWNNDNANVVCQMLGYGNKGTAFKVTLQNEEVPTWNINYQCKGNEASLDCCQYQTLESSQDKCEKKIYVAVDCKVSLPVTEPVTISPLPPVKPSVVTCGNRLVDKQKIIGGHNAVYGEYPWQVRVIVKENDLLMHICGATIMDDFHIISAAHCFESLQFRPEMVILRVGDFDEYFNAEEEDFEVETIIPHENYAGLATYYNYDIVVMKIKAKQGKGINFGKYVQPACLIESQADPKIGTLCLISGWGYIAGHTMPTTLQGAEVKILSNKFCGGMFSYDGAFSENMLCAGYVTGGIDSCQGDSGGPLVCNIQGKFTLTGVVSWGNNCSLPGYPGIYTRLTKLRKWIDEKLKM